MHSTYYEYNVQGKMVKVTQGVQTRYFLYDSLGRLIRVKQPEQEVNDALDKSDPATGNGKWTAKFTYDLFGNVLTTTDAKGVTITSTYDKANRVLTKVFSGEPQGQTTPSVEYFYDGYGLDTAPPATNNYAKGKLTKVTSSISETRYTKFDQFGRLTESEQRTPFGSEPVANATPQITKYKYDFGGRLIEETYPSGRVVKNTFEADGDLANVVSKAAAQVGFKTYVSNFSYTAAGGISQLQLGNGKWETAKFNTRQQVEELGLGNAYNDTSLWKLNFTYGELESNGTVNLAKNTGNIAKQTVTIGGLAQPFVQTYKYDSLYRLTEAKEVNGTGTTANWSQQFSYDRYGNRIGFNQQIGSLTTSNLPTVNTANNRFADNQGFKYDKAGNIIEDREIQQVRSFVFNAYNKQIEINRNGALVGRYFYDGEGKRVKKQTDLETTIFVYSAGKLVAEYSTKMPENPTTNYTTTDHLGSPRVVTDKLGQIKSRRDFMPFGEELAADATYRTAGLKYGAADEVRQKFTGYQKDTETSLDFAEARMYNNQHGRFTAVDPLLTSSSMMVPQTWNRYVYVGNNPINITDPTGEKWAIRKYDENGSPMVSFIWYDQKLTDEQVAEGWTDYDYKTNRFYVSDNYVWYLSRDQQDFVMVNRLVFDFVNGEGSFGSLHGGPSGEFTQETKKKIMDAVLYTLNKENRDPIQRMQKEMGQMIAGGVAARGPYVINKVPPKLVPLPQSPGFIVNPTKFDYFFGRVVSGSKHNIDRSAQNLKELTKMGIENENQLMGVFQEAFREGTTVSTKINQYGTTVNKMVYVGQNGKLEVSFFYPGSNMGGQPSVTTIIPKTW